MGGSSCPCYVPTGHDGRGPQVRQTSNAYRLTLPARALRLLGRLMQTPSLPDDVSQAHEQHRAEQEAYRASLTLASSSRCMASSKVASRDCNSAFAIFRSAICDTNSATSGLMSSPEVSLGPGAHF